MSHPYNTMTQSMMIPVSPTSMLKGMNVFVDDFIHCARCRFGGCDLKVVGCGCSVHARCFPLMEQRAPMTACPLCGSPASGLSLYPMNFTGIDEAEKAAKRDISKAAEKRGRKRKNSVISQDDVSVQTNSSGKSGKNSRVLDASKDLKETASTNLRTGRWTTEEMAFCDKLVNCFKNGQLPIAEGTKLNDFLSNVLNSKQSRLTKKMKNAKLSSNTYLSKTSFIESDQLCYEFSALEDNFFLAISDAKERAALKFHMQKLWREFFSSHCVRIGQSLDMDEWLSSVEEMDRRVAVARDASRMQRRKLTMGYALCQDSLCPEAGVFIERSQDEIEFAQNNEPFKPDGDDMTFNPMETDEMLALLNDETPSDHCNGIPNGDNLANFEMVGKSCILHNSPFLNKIMSYIKRHNVPFEHVDLWVPNFENERKDQPCILGFAGCATADQEIPESGKAPAEKIDEDAKFNLYAFGDYSQKFSFSVGSGLPGRVFKSCEPTWESGVNISDNTCFERCGAAYQWGIKTLVAIPIPSPTVGRIVLVLYSRHVRKPNFNLVNKLTDEFKKLLPTPRWKLVIDMGSPSSQVSSDPTSIKPLMANSMNHMPSTSMRPTSSTSSRARPAVDPRVSQLVNLLVDQMSSSAFSSNHHHGHEMISLRLLLLKSNRTTEEEDLVQTILASYSSYMLSGRPLHDIAAMIVRDYSFMTKSQMTLHYSNYNHSARVDQQISSSHVTSIDHSQYQSDPTTTEFSPLEPKIKFYSFAEGADLDNWRPQSPVFSPLEDHTFIDALSVVSN